MVENNANTSNTFLYVSWRILNSLSPWAEQPSQDVLGLEHKPNSDAQQMDLGNSMKFDHLGPIIVNADGTMSRIANWDTLSPQEQATTFRLISARNAQRLKALREQEAQAKEATDS
eukprot:TRINITY_DN7923_c0_g1_i3.p1 TRINITY_DN7923_c0_g1~~TRINITY_DN7923_c0_g1_i3.p1  ORF type:complete len:116 (+),score=17.44 TRINITY_DN7923_c0_g1_i3:138-485(+)